MDRTGVLRTLHDVGGAAWFGGSLMGATGLNAAADAAGPADRDRVVTAGWERWAPLAKAALGAHVLGSVGLLATRRDRASVMRLALTTAAVGATAGTAKLGADPNTPASTMHKLEWAIPVLLAGVVAIGVKGR
ncbi:hypothetical protein [Pseudonocardia sp. GCM10023141]|uniref:hypothetical protein n=1 Tax=Pseudonocardia sp. GCM10023141 TaxID=3252653 RepID=UPI00361E6252